MKPARAKIAPPFFANTPDDTHCFQAVIRGILKHFLPDREFSWEELDHRSAKLPGMATWPQAMLVSLRETGFDVVAVEGFDGHDFIKRGADYLADAFGKEAADWQIAHSDIAGEQKNYQKMYDAGVKCENRIPNLSELRTYLQRGYLLECLVNARILNGKTGYVGHFVLVYDMDDSYVTLHDPGLPGHEAQQVPLADFEKAWASPNENAKGFVALKYERKIYA
jgi:peptidase C3-like protein